MVYLPLSSIFGCFLRFSSVFDGSDFVVPSALRRFAWGVLRWSCSSCGHVLPARLALGMALLSLVQYKERMTISLPSYTIK